MQLSLPWRFGQNRPFSSIPCINWAHPLAAGLQYYLFDCGCGVVIDLVSGAQGALTIAGSPTVGSISTSYIGTAYKFVAQPGVTTSWCVNLPSLPRGLTFGNTFPYSYACGYIPTANAGSLFNPTILFTCADSGNNTGPYYGMVGSSLTPCFGFGNTTQTNSTATLTANIYATGVGVALTSTTGTGYAVQGLSAALFKVDSLTISSTATPAGVVPVFGDGTSGTGSNHIQGYNGFIFYAAAWQPRTLTQEEVRQLHDDPWCLLWYPEDDIFAELVGAAGPPPSIIPAVFSVANATNWRQTRIRGY